jgi:hypothetical protein
MTVGAMDNLDQCCVNVDFYVQEEHCPLLLLIVAGMRD